MKKSELNKLEVSTIIKIKKNDNDLITTIAAGNRRVWPFRKQQNHDFYEIRPVELWEQQQGNIQERDVTSSVTRVFKEDEIDFALHWLNNIARELLIGSVRFHKYVIEPEERNPSNHRRENSTFNIKNSHEESSYATDLSLYDNNTRLLNQLDRLDDTIKIKIIRDNAMIRYVGIISVKGFYPWRENPDYWPNGDKYLLRPVISWLDKEHEIGKSGLDQIYNFGTVRFADYAFYPFECLLGWATKKTMNYLEHIPEFHEVVARRKQEVINLIQNQNHRR